MSGSSRAALVAVAGLMASGKSTVAAALAEALDAESVSADETRQELYEAGRREAFVPGFSATLYPAVLARVGRALAAGRSVVVDATFRTRALRADARDTAHRHGARFLLVECAASRERCRARLREREEPGWVEMFEPFLAEWEPIDELDPAEHCVVDTEGAFRPAALRPVLAALDAAD